jgi:hypothetical protein
LLPILFIIAAITIKKLPSQKVTRMDTYYYETKKDVKKDFINTKNNDDYYKYSFSKRLNRSLHSIWDSFWNILSGGRYYGYSGGSGSSGGDGGGGCGC